MFGSASLPQNKLADLEGECLNLCEAGLNLFRVHKNEKY